MSQVILFGVFGVGNLGNDATLLTMTHHLRQRLQTQVLCVCSHPELVQERYGVASIPIDIPLELLAAGPSNRWLRRLNRGVTEVKLWRAALQRFAQGDHLVFTGTGMLDDFGVRPWNLPYDLVKWCTAARLRGARVSFVSVGAGPIEQTANRWLMLQALRQGGYRSYRDRQSKEYLQGIGFDSRADAVYPDLVFSWPVDSLPPRRPPATPPRVIGVGVMGYYGWRNQVGDGEAIYQAYYTKLRSFVVWLVAQGYEVRLIIGETPTDLRPVRELLAEPGALQAAQQAGQLAAPPIENAADVLAALAETDLLVATRFHNVVSAYLLGRPVLSVGYSTKNDALQADAGLGDFCQQVDDFDVARLQVQFQQLVARAGEAGRAVAERVATYRSQLDEQYDRLFGSAAVPVTAAAAPAATGRSN